MKNEKKYLTIKVRLKDILKINIDPDIETYIYDTDLPFNIINNTVINCNKLVINVYQFLRLFILYKHKHNNPIPEITFDIIKSCFIILSKQTNHSGKRITNNSLNLFDELTDFYINEYSNLGYYDKIDKTGMAQIISFLSIEILTSINNNVIQHFVSYLNKFVNCFFKEEHEKIINECTTKDAQQQMKKYLKKELTRLKKDLIEGKECSNEHYQEWYDNYKNQILPITYDISYYNDINNNPQKYLKYMITMNQILEEKKYKMFQFFPQRTSIIPKHIPIDTTTIVNILINDTTKKEKLLKKINQEKDNIWELFFKMDKKVFRSSTHRFDYMITTNGYDASIRMIEKKEGIKKEKGKIKKQECAKKVKKENVGLTAEQRANNKEQRKNNKKNKKLSENKENNEKNNKETKENKSNEFQYIDDLSKDIIENLKKEIVNFEKKEEIVYCDPGKNNLYMFMKVDKKTGEKIYLRYSNKQRLKETKRIEYQEIIEKYRDKTGIILGERNLSLINLKTCNYDLFKKNIEMKN